MRRKFIFIVNPIAGDGYNIKRLNALIELYKSVYDFKIIETKRREPIRNYIGSIDRKSLIVAVGGDGTVNAVAQYCYETNRPMSIIGLGSGNGLARHLELNLDPFLAFKQILNGKERKIDIGFLNKVCFFNVAGLGFDGYVAHLFDIDKKRGFLAYVKAFIKALNEFKSFHFELDIDGTIINSKGFLITIANGSQYGNNIFIAPEAKLNDGLFDIVILKYIGWRNLLYLILKMRSKKLAKFKSVSYFKGKKIIINKFECNHAHIDGEPMLLKSSSSIELVADGLTIIK